MNPWVWWRQWRRAWILSRSRIGGDAWNRALAEVPAARTLSDADRGRLRDIATLFLHDKAVEAAGGLQLTEPMRIRIACEACIPILNLDLDCYRGWHAVIVYPGEFIARHEYHDDAGVVHVDEDARSGESWDAGPVIVSWGDVEAAEPGYSVIIHEMAHKLDMLDGDANGCPPLHRGMRPEEWARVFTKAYAEMERRVNEDDGLEMDDYALEDPGEFFAVASEYFFAAPEVLRREFPDVYGQLAHYYRQRPG